MLEVIDRGFMPPWPPDEGYVRFAAERRLSKPQVQVLRDWVESGLPEGNAGDLPPDPQWQSGWTLGEPDLVVSFPEPFAVPANAPDVYRNFVIPIPLDRARYVKAVEIDPSNYRVAHHMFVRVDRTGRARKLDGRDGQPGFGGMDPPSGVHAPQGCILSWQVGKVASPEPEGVAWELQPGTDFVVEFHMQATGKPELVQPRIGLYFTDRPPTRFPFLLTLRQLDIDIPPGDSDYSAKMEYVLPVSVEATAVLPHAHYLGKQLDGHAVLPDGSRQWLIRISDWDFNWQGEYRYANPLQLPAGSKIVLDYHYDNSAENVRNPNVPPRRVQYGPESTDEMAELALQVVPSSRKDLQRLSQHFNGWRLKHELIPQSLRTLQKATDPQELADAHLDLGKAYLVFGQNDAAISHFEQAVESPEATAEAFYYVGRVLVTQGQLARGKQALERAYQLDPTDLNVLNGLGLVWLTEKNYDKAAEFFRSAVAHGPTDQTAYVNLGVAMLNLGRPEQAIEYLEKAIEIEPDAKASKYLEQARAMRSARIRP